MEFMLYTKAMHSIPLEELRKRADLIAHVECSGSEGIYVEVGRIGGDRRIYRYAFAKFFDVDEAKEIAAQVQSYHPLIHMQPPYEGNEAGECEYCGVYIPADKAVCSDACEKAMNKEYASARAQLENQRSI